MPIVVTLNVHTGQINPTWILSEEQTNQLREKILSCESKETELTPSGASGNLTYSGFTVYSIHVADFPRRLLVHEGILHFGRYGANKLAEGREIEKWLLTSSLGILPDRIRDYVNEILNRKTVSKKEPPKLRLRFRKNRYPNLSHTFGIMLIGRAGQTIATTMRQICRLVHTRNRVAHLGVL